jgi:8-oxo-dGTP diphosphatase
MMGTAHSAHDSPRPPIAAAVVVKDGRVLLVRRRISEGSLSWQFPAGQIEPGESAEEAAVREAHEETNLTVTATRFLGERAHPITGCSMIYVACDAIDGEARILDEDLVELTWSTRDQLLRYVPDGFLATVRDYLDAKLLGDG